VSKSEPNTDINERVAFLQLERVVGQALSRLESSRLRAEAAEAKSAELQELLRRFTEDGEEAGRMITRLRTLEAENADLRDRLERGRDGVERVLARIRFIEGQR
jgi:hypothetical protein